MDASHSGGSEVARTIWIVGSPIIFSFGLVGNIITMIVLMGRKTRKTSTTVFLTLLALADILLILVALPRWWLIYLFGIEIRHLSDIMCKIHFFLVHVGSNVSSCCLAVITIERVISTWAPFVAKKKCTPTIATVTSVVLTLIIISLEIHILYGFSLQLENSPTGDTGSHHNFNEEILENITNDASPRPHENTTLSDANVNLMVNETDIFITYENTTRAISAMYICWINDDNYRKFYNEIFSPIQLATSFALPMLILVTGGVLIISKFAKCGSFPSKFTKPRTLEPGGPKLSSLRRHSTQITVTILLVNTVFLLGETPVAIFVFGRSLWIDQKVGMTTTQEIVWAVCNQLYYINHAVNFMLYFLTGSRFRKHVFDLLNCKRAVELSETSSGQSSAL